MEKVTAGHWDWKSAPGIEELNEFLNPLGVKVYPDPAWKGTDEMGFIFSKEDLSKDEIKAHSRKLWLEWTGETDESFYPG